MFDENFSILFDACARRRRLIVALAVALTAVAAVGLQWISLDDNLELMLPGNEAIHRSLRFLQESHFSDDVIVSLELKSPDRSPEELIQAARRLEGSLRPPLVTGVVSGISEGDVVDETVSLLRYLPELVDESALSRIDAQLNAEGIERSLRRSYRLLANPASALLTPFVRSDPLGIGSGVFNSLRALSSSLGYRIELQDGHFISPDGAHSMFVVQTPVTITDASGSRELISYLRERLRELPDFVRADLIGGHLHTISNEEVIKRDIWLALGIAGAAFFCLFVLLFRDARAAILLFLPVASVLVAINLSSLMVSHLSCFIVGMGGVVTGIAVDYGIHVYMAVRSQQGRVDAVKRVAKPVLTGALTTLAVFGAFFFSSVPGYRQLALFSILSIALCLASALFLLPHLLGAGGRLGSGGRGAEVRVLGSSALGGIIVACWVVALIGAALAMRGLSFSTDLRRFDGSQPSILEAEEKFHRIWGGESRPAVFVVPGRSLEEALSRNRMVYRDALAVVKADEFTSVATVWPSSEERIANRLRWEAFWKDGRESTLRSLLREHGPAYGFSDDAFSPFFESLYADGGAEDGLERLEIFAKLKERFVQERPEGWQLLSFFPDEERLLSRLSRVSARHPGTFVVSRNAFSQELSRSVSSEIVYLFAVAALLVPPLAGLLLRDLRLTALSLVPVVTAVMAILGTIPALGLSLDGPSLLSAMVAVGLCIDYGIFMVYECHYRLETGTLMAVTLSAVTTLIGAGALLFARHPLLFSIGLTMVTGVLAGYVSSMLVVPPLYHRFVGAGARSR
jgi:predicted exporter